MKYQITINDIEWDFFSCTVCDKLYFFSAEEKPVCHNQESHKLKIRTVPPQALSVFLKFLLCETCHRVNSNGCFTPTECDCCKDVNLKPIYEVIL